MPTRHTFWIFDMDGTLTLAAHDFQGFKKAHGLPVDRPILESIDNAAPEQAAHWQRCLQDWERDIAHQAQCAPDAIPLLQHLHRRGDHLGILTRNTRELAMITLQQAGLLSFFEPAVILGRDSATPKPDPAGIFHILNHWGGPVEQTTMVGDGIFDLEAGRNAGVRTVWINRMHRTDPARQARADRVVHRLDALLDPDDVLNWEVPSQSVPRPGRKASR